MALDDFSRHQQGIIKRYYANQPALSLQKLAELVTELYLAEGKQRQKLWKSAAAALDKLDVPKSRIDHLLAKDDPALLAGVVKELSKPG
jgi:hypothetical protein